MPSRSKRKEAARFSFLLSTPIIFGAAVYQTRDLIATGLDLNQVAGIVAAATSINVATARDRLMPSAKRVNSEPNVGIQ